MEQHTYDTYAENKPGYWPVVLVVVALGAFAWVLLNQFHKENEGYIWDKQYIAAEHEGHGPESHSGHESHGGPASLQEPKHGGEMQYGNATTGRLDSLTGNFIYETGEVEPISLTDSLSINAGSNSSEARLVAFLKTGTVDTADKTKGWITLDRFYFETGKSVITPSSREQLKNIASILKAYPDASLKIGGYTDDAGTPEANMTLSASRANAAKNALTGLGIAAGRLSAEGYGQEHPIADNGAAEGKARNRRVDVRVVKK